MPQGVEYQILMADREGCPPIAGLKFTDPAEAAAQSKILSRQMGEKLMVKPITNDKWRQREQKRINDGIYRPLPWAEEKWWYRDAFPAWKDQYPHPSIERPGFIAYTKDEKDGTIDKQTIVRPGAYLKKYFSGVMTMYGLSERRLIDQFMTAYGPLDVQFAKTEDEIISVYDHGPDTCMKDKNWPGDERNPAYIYAAGDLQVAYLGSLECAKARTLVWPEKKIFSRVYGDIARLTRGLERLGYKWGPPVGARVKRVQVKPVKFDPRYGSVTGCFIAPYIDKRNERGGGHLSVMDKGEHLVICEEGLPGSHHCGLPDGLTGQYVPRADEYPTFTCERCDTPGFRQLHTVLTDTDDGEEMSWCQKCTMRNAFQCNYSGTWFDTEKVKRAVVDGVIWAEYYAEMYAEPCAMSGDLCNKENMYTIHFEDGAKRVSRNWVDNNGGIFKSHITRRCYLRAHQVTVRSYFDGNAYAGEPELKYHAFCCDGCGFVYRIHERYQSKGDDRLFCHPCDDRIQKLKEAPELKLENLTAKQMAYYGVRQPY